MINRRKRIIQGNEVQAVGCEQKSCARIAIRNFLANIVHVIDLAGFTCISDFDNLAIQGVIIRLSICLVGDHEAR